MSELARLKWQCRRGTLELDLFLSRYLETGYASANEEERAEFVQLLELEDTELLPFLMGERVPSSKKQASLVSKIRSSVAASSGLHK
ncbi:MAG: succinate dehydrogenase assembly factor 2 [Methylococcales bacterium]